MFSICRSFLCNKSRTVFSISSPVVLTHYKPVGSAASHPFQTHNVQQRGPAHSGIHHWFRLQVWNRFMPPPFLSSSLYLWMWSGLLWDHLVFCLRVTKPNSSSYQLSSLWHYLNVSWVHYRIGWTFLQVQGSCPGLSLQQTRHHPWGPFPVMRDMKCCQSIWSKFLCFFVSLTLLLPCLEYLIHQQLLIFFKPFSRVV